MGDIGEPIKRIEFVPMPDDVPIPEYVPSAVPETAPAASPELEPVGAPG